jgi:HD-GYP domain-containing protein (c-di-GMP phosphodiesterase class II)
VPFSKKDESLITHFATIATVALQRAYITRVMILRMIKMAELRDPNETGTHVSRVASYAVEIYDQWAHNNNIPQAKQENTRDILKIGSMLHDVGKVAISDTILNKPARFTAEEFEVMQHHTLYGASLFDDPQSSIDEMAREIALTHHENWDGSGYPSRLIGEEIPLAGRIVAIADVFDALSTRRVYKEAWSEEQVLNEMKHLSGKKFDPELIGVFFEVLPNIKHAQRLYPERLI